MHTSHPQDVLGIQGLKIHIPTENGLVRAVDGIDLTVAPGQILAVVGESGSGKSLTARAVLGMLPPRARTEGVITLDGQAVLSSTEEQLRELRGSSAAMVFQEPSLALNPVYTVGWQIQQGLRAHGLTDRGELRKRTIEILTAVGIPEPETRIDYYPHQFSGGQKQRIVIAAALVLEPRLIIADEPTTALDVTVQAEILNLLRRCRDELGASIMLITHNMGVVADIADEVAVMYHGQLVERGNVFDIFAEPQHGYTRQLLSAVPRLQVAGAAQISQQESSGEERQGPENASRPVVSLRDVNVVYPGAGRGAAYHALKDLSFDIYPREILGLVGESGSGKSTAGRTVAGLVQARDGRVEVFGEDLAELKSKEARDIKRRMGFIFQDPASSFNPFFTVAECISEPVKAQRLRQGKQETERRVSQLLDAVHLPNEVAHRYPHELSGGQRQRIAIARALMLDPEFVIADEPTSALDVSVQERVLEIFTSLQAELGFSCLFISHDLAVVQQLADRVAVLRGGALVEIGKVNAVLENPRDEYTRQLLAAVPVPDPVIQRNRAQVGAGSGRENCDNARAVSLGKR